MTSSFKGKIYRIRNTSGTDTVFLSEVRPEEGHHATATIKEAKSERMCISGVDTYWLVANEKSETKNGKKKAADKLPAVPMTDTAVGMLQRAVTGKGHGHDFAEFIAANIEHISFSSATQLSTGYSLSASDGAEKIATFLHERSITLPTRSQVNAIEIKQNVWLKAGLHKGEGSNYRLASNVDIRAAETVSLIEPSSAAILPSGVVIFPPGVRWTEPVRMDLRSEEEILASVEKWIDRIQASLGEDHPSVERLGTLIRQVERHTASSDDLRDLEAVAGILASRNEIRTIVLRLLSETVEWKAAAEKFRAAEFARISQEAEARAAEEAAKLEAVLDKRREDLSSMELRIEQAAHRESVLKAESASIHKDIESMIEKAARDIAIGDAENASILSDDISNLRKDMDDVLKKISGMTEPHEQAPRSEPSAAEPEVETAFSTAEERAEQLKKLSEATGISPPRLYLLISWARSYELPVLVGDCATRRTIDVSTAVGADRSHVVFCDPTKISLDDLMRSVNGGGLAAAIESARAAPGQIVTVALCNITSGPCEFWLPEFMELRRLGRLPANLACFASASTDGVLARVPRSALGYIVPFKIGAGPIGYSPGRNFGAWPSDIPGDASRQMEALPLLATSAMEPSKNPDLLARAAEIISAKLSSPGPAVADVVSAAEEQFKWLIAVRSGGEHELIKEFQKSGR